MMRKKPMLAYPVSDKPIDYTKPTFIQPKLDGVRCLIQYERHTQPREDVVVAYSRTGKVWKNIDHILSSLRPFFQKYPDVILDGELYNHDLKTISSLSYLWSENKNQPQRTELNHVRMYNFIVTIL
jgi:ATP-dependent DNA ligase